MLKPDVVFFGENMSENTREESRSLVEQCSSLLVVGSSLKVFSAFRLVQNAVSQGKPVLVLSLGETRADSLPIQKLDCAAESVFPKLFHS